jgi:CheY-like chemotaxis protein
MSKYEGLECILLIDDDKAANFIHTLTIQATGIQVQVQNVENAQDGLDYLTCKGKFSHCSEFPRPGIVFLDINMPGMSGWDFLNEYEKLPEEVRGHLVIAMLTTSLNPDDADQAREFGYLEGFINKPLTKEAVRNIVEKNFKLED